MGWLNNPLGQLKKALGMGSTSDYDFLKKEGEGERLLRQQGARDFNTYVREFLPLQRQFLERSRATPAEARGLRGLAVARAAQTAAKAQQGLRGKPLGLRVLGTTAATGLGAMQSANAIARLLPKLQQREAAARLAVFKSGLRSRGAQVAGAADLDRLANSVRLSQDAKVRAGKEGLQEVLGTGLGTFLSVYGLGKSLKGGGTGGTTYSVPTSDQSASIYSGGSIYL